jgi:methylamine utilization protein MauE
VIFLADLVILCRSIVALAFLFSAGWKISHPGQFNAVVAGGPQSLRRVRRRLLSSGPAIAAVEVIVAAALIICRPSWIPALAAVLFLGIFSLFLLRADSLANGCGCWRAPQRRSDSARFYIVRNSLLAVFACVGGIWNGSAPTGQKVAVAALAIIPALLIMEIPTIAEFMEPRHPAHVTINIE